MIDLRKTPTAALELKKNDRVLFDGQELYVETMLPNDDEEAWIWLTTADSASQQTFDLLLCIHDHQASGDLYSKQIRHLRQNGTRFAAMSRKELFECLLADDLYID